MPVMARLPMLKSMPQAKATSVLILANIGVYLAGVLLDTRSLEQSSTNSFLIQWGANVPALTLSGEFWRLGSSMFLHMELLHLAMNMLALFVIGRMLEARMRTPVFLGIYLLSGLTGSLATVLWHRDDLLISCGASGAILGLFGAALALALNGMHVGVPLRNLVVSLVLTFAAGAFFSLDNAAHLGGLAAGFPLALLAGLALRMRPLAAGAAIAAGACMAALALVAICYAHYDSDMRGQLASAKLASALNHIGLGGPATALGGVLEVEQCIAEALHGNPAGQLQGCAHAGGEWSDLLARYLPARFDACRETVAELERLETDPARAQVLAMTDRYCAAQAQVYGLVFGNAADDVDVDVDVQAAANARDAMNDLLLASAGYGRQSDRARLAPVHAFKALLQRAGDLSMSVVEASACPYWTCRRFPD